jgi:hypothetical protein
VPVPAAWWEWDRPVPAHRAEQPPAADALQPPLRCGFQARLRRSVRRRRRDHDRRNVRAITSACGSSSESHVHRGPRAELGDRPGFGNQSCPRWPGEVVGPVATPEGCALALIEERRPGELDAATRQRIQDELFDRWLAGRMKEATLNPRMAGPPA